jgi:hypothetical protein
MTKKILFLFLLVAGQGVLSHASDYFNLPYGQCLSASTERVGLWWASSGWKISQDKPLPETTAPAITIRAARNEAEAAQLVIQPKSALNGFVISPKALAGPSGAIIPAENIEVFKVQYVNVTQPTDKSSVAGLWPDPLLPLKGPIDVEANKNQPFWIRVKVPRDIPAGIYTGKIHLAAQNYGADVTLQVEVYDFVLPDRMTCTTAFGFSPDEVFRYQKLSDRQQKQQVLDKYWASFSAHHVSPYDPAPLDPINVTWPDIRPPQSKWEGGLVVTNEKHNGQRCLLIFDDRRDDNVTVTYSPLIEIPKGGLRISFYHRTAMPNQMFQVSLNHYAASGNWISGNNNDLVVEGTGNWQQFEQLIEKFPPAAKSIRLHLRATPWTEAGERTGLVWFDDVSLSDAATGKGLIEGGDFELQTLPPAEQEKLQVRFDFAGWDNAMQRAIDYYHFNSFQIHISGLGGGTFHARSEPELLGFTEDTPHYKVLFASYCRQIQEHLRRKDWLDEAFVYWFDEPDPKDYKFVANGFAKLKGAAPDINRMLTEQVEPELVGGPNIWCPVTPNYNHQAAEERRKSGEKFWWYICCGPKAPYCTLFIDHPGTELRVWLWQTWQRKIDGILVWQTNYWTSSAAYPKPNQPQNPYEDPMSWVSGYSTPEGKKEPWGNGDGRFIYPPQAAADAHPAEPVLDGPVESIRWEMLRDGIEDYEYLSILSNLLKDKKDKLTAQQHEEYTALVEVPEDITKDMTTFTKDPAPIEARRDQMARAIAKLNKL